MYLHARLEFAGCRGESAAAVAVRRIFWEKLLFSMASPPAAGLKMQIFARAREMKKMETGRVLRQSFILLLRLFLLGAKNAEPCQTRHL
jgi:hypothetical protein